jgi:hypothetical protein
MKESPNSLNSSKGRQNVFVIVFALVAFAIVLTPLQHYVTLSRSQHYGLSLCALGIGYFVQVFIGWTKLSKWERLCYLTTACFFTSVAYVFMQNSWLDAKSSVQTEEQEATRKIIVSCYLVFGLFMCGMWLRLIFDNMKSNSAQKQRRQP